MDALLWWMWETGGVPVRNVMGAGKLCHGTAAVAYRMSRQGAL